MQEIARHIEPMSVQNGFPVEDVSRRPVNERSAEFLQYIIDASPSSIAILDENRTVLHINKVWRQFAVQSGLRERELGVGQKYPELGTGVASASPEDAAEIRAGILRVIQNREIEFSKEYRSTAVAENVWFRLHAAAFRQTAEDGGVRVLLSHDEISSEKLVSEALKNGEDRLHRLLSMTNIMPWEADAETWAFTYVGEQAEQILGYPAENWFGPDFWTDHIHPDDRGRAVESCSRLAESLDQYQFEYRMIAKDGRIVWIQDMVSVIRQNGRPKTLRGFMIDVTDRKEAEGALRDLSGRLINAQEEERKRIARELHDDLNQRMALMSIELEQMSQLAAGSGLDGRLLSLQRRAQEISTDIHRMSYELHPSKLDHLGLVPALNSFCRELARSRDVKIYLTHDDGDVSLTPEKTLCVFRIAQEALQNAAKHSGASEIRIRLAKTDHSVDLEVSDRGCGFDVNSKKMTEGLGFTSMRERLRVVQGRMQVHSKPTVGSRIEVSIPLKDALTRRSHYYL